MRFQRGCKVEVLRQVEVPPGSCHCAEIVCANGSDYTIRYANSSNEKIVEKLSRNSIRPCPPPSELSVNWVSGDVLEVFDDYSWKMATISKALGRKQYLVRLLGSSLEIKISKADMRLRQAWKDNKWVVVGKGSGSYYEGKHDGSLSLKYNESFNSQVRKTNTRMDLPEKVDFFPAENKSPLQESGLGSSRYLKRPSPYENSQVERCVGPAKKIRGIVKDGRFLIPNTPKPTALPKHVEVASLQRKSVGDKCIQVSTTNQRTRYFGLDIEKRRSNDADTVTCSVGSCSLTSNNSVLPRAGPTEESGSLSDAESCCQWGYREEHQPPRPREELAEEIHRIELHAYCRTIGALHASGPLSWEKEALVTNLRLLLNISNDEHLMMIRSLISAGNSIHNR